MVALRSRREQLDEVSSPLRRLQCTDAGFQDFFRRVEHHKHKSDLPVAVAMEGFNGYARPLDQLIQERGYTLYNVNNLKLARFKEGLK